VKRIFKTVLLVMLFAALPLRGYSASLAVMCESHHGGGVNKLEHAHEHGDGHTHEADDGAGDSSPATSVCGFCASCCASSTLAPGAPLAVAIVIAATDRFSFVDRRSSGFVPAHLDRPPLAL